MKTIDVGLDLGATLAKAVLVPSEAPLSGFESVIFEVSDQETIARFLHERPVRRLALTGGGARSLKDYLGSMPQVVVTSEFESWGEGERAVLKESGLRPSSPHLLVSVGTGTSILKVDVEGRVTRVGGTALGGGTLRGLGLLLLGESRHVALAEMARQGDSRRVDLLVSDLYRPGEIALMPDLTAANFGKVRSKDPRDLAAALTRLIGENIGLLAGSLAIAMARDAKHRPDVLYAGSTLRGHELLREILGFATTLVGAEAHFLPRGEFIGALGALRIARAAA